MALIDRMMSNQCTAGKRKHLTLMIPLTFEIIASLESGKSWSDVASYNFGLSTLYDIKKQKDQL